MQKVIIIQITWNIYKKWVWVHVERKWLSLGTPSPGVVFCLSLRVWDCGCGYNNSCQSNKNFSHVSLEGYLFFADGNYFIAFASYHQVHTITYFGYGYDFSFIRKRICMQISRNSFKWILKFWNLFLWIRVVSGFSFFLQILIL